ncbi:MAG UNVERIFIED_CONTAM: hypothetical protein LVR18_18280 [Planctomycetaceae bacterium]
MTNCRHSPVAAGPSSSCRGYARVDFRVDEDGQPWILEINVNPCLSPDAGFAAALAEQKLTLDAAVQRIIEDAFR